MSFFFLFLTVIYLIFLRGIITPLTISFLNASWTFGLFGRCFSCCWEYLVFACTIPASWAFKSCLEPLVPTVKAGNMTTLCFIEVITLVADAALLFSSSL